MDRTGLASKIDAHLSGGFNYRLLMEEGVTAMYFALRPSHALLLVSRAPVGNIDGRDSFLLFQFSTPDDIY